MLMCLIIIFIQDHLHLGNERFVTVQSFKGHLKVDIRQYTKYGDKIYPTKLGTHLTETQFANLLLFIKEIDNDLRQIRDNKVESFKYNIGSEMFVAASRGFPVIHIRFFYQNDEMPVALPTKSGIALRYAEWDTLVKLIESVQKRIELLETV